MTDHQKNSDSNNGRAGSAGTAATAITSKHWAQPSFFNDNVLLDALLKHILGLMPYGMTDFGEVMDVVHQLKGSDEEAWVSAWSALASRLQDRAEEADRKGRRVTAASAYLRASTYWRCALLYFSDFEDKRMREYAVASASCYERHISMSGYPAERVEIPYEDGFLPGYFYRSPHAGEKAPLLIVTPGRDTWAEDTRWVCEGALQRGIHCLTYDGPGQGFALRLNNLTFRPDWEKVVSPLIDFALEKFSEIDASKIALMGLSFGGYLAPRAAAFDKRIKLCITDPGNISWGREIIKQLEPLADRPLAELPEQLRNLVSDYAWKHGVPNSIKDVVQALQPYDNSAILDQVTCETLVLDGTGEVFHGAKSFYDALQSPKEYLLFDESSTAQSHCQIGGYATATEYIFDKVAERLGCA
ncbi:alpha/beta fold hydrolase [Stenotrophomonas maltophilia]|nr:alpha/beta fold hydrolase [Stenotrophomonas maltophilia]MBA0468551.1 alpha/beta fold hydrolase [Stenotrophomonas maltophilia]MBA0475404.1 alpha/beta fold hydrolase [Stenotrophomonas maltophilia]MBA0484872.1 alpha/beta fold hydrolase [Stenotrophomonas maltophilia]